MPAQTGSLEGASLSVDVEQALSKFQIDRLYTHAVSAKLLLSWCSLEASIIEVSNEYQHALLFAYNKIRFSIDKDK